MTPEDTYKEVDKICKRFAAELGEYVEHGQFMLTFGNDSHTSYNGFGNFHARRGMAQEFLDRDRARNAHEVEYSEFKD